ncbi:hypothetical protein DVH29_15610 [Pelagibacterium lacus]|uniref:Uncharacterized protein n=1 Tax=Pelagibacterium lacus TaxID=2282655 RepID=A0A369W2Q6_9HYPH|nr:hypothetical protein DVH29_15610 [Pelagibacterium lacus]
MSTDLLCPEIGIWHWRRLPESQWQVTPTTARLLRHWRTHEFANQKPFFCQVEAVETVIWMTEVAPRSSSQGRLRTAVQN